MRDVNTVLPGEKVYLTAPGYAWKFGHTYVTHTNDAVIVLDPVHVEVEVPFGGFLHLEDKAGRVLDLPSPDPVLEAGVPDLE